MTRPVLLQAIALLPDVDRHLAETYTVHKLPPAGPERDALLAQHGASIDGLVTSARAGFDGALLARLPNLRVVSSFGVGLDTLDVPAARARGIPVEIIQLSGSVELAPALGLADMIVDLVETGQTLRENGLSVVDEIAESTGRLVVNRASYQLKAEEVSRLLNALTTAK